MCSECYTGWLTHWGEAGANTSSSAPHVDSILGEFKGSISLYMGHGGTNFGWFSGANGGGGSSFQPHVTSYDYDSPVSEAGEHGYHASVDKYAAMQKVLLAHSPSEDVAAAAASPEPPLLPRAALGAWSKPPIRGHQLLLPPADWCPMLAPRTTQAPRS